MAKQSPKYRGIYTYVAANKPDGVTVKASPKYRGIYAFDATNKPSGTLLDFSEHRVTGNTTEDGEAVSLDAYPEDAATEPAPWDSMTTHNQLDTYLNDNELSQPAGWSSKTVAQKKEWLDQNG